MDANSFALCTANADPLSASGHYLGSVYAAKRKEVLVTVQGDGALCYNSSKQTRVRSWPVGNHELQFPARVVFDQSSRHYFGVLQAPGEKPVLLAWPDAPADGSALRTLAEVPARGALAKDVHSLYAINASTSQTEELDAGPPASSTGAIAVHKDGSLSAFRLDAQLSCSLSASEGDRCLTEAAAASQNEAGSSTSVQVGTLLVLAVVTSEGSADGRVHVLRLVHFIVEAGDKVQLAVRHKVLLEHGKGASETCRVLAVSCSSGGAVSVLWSDGCWEVYDSSSGLLKRTLTRKLTAFQLAHSAPISQPTPGKSSKKRRNPTATANTPSTQPLVALSSIPNTPYIAVAGYRLNDSLGLAILDTEYGCVHGVVSIGGEAAKLQEGFSGPLGLQVRGDGGEVLVTTPQAVVVAEVELPPLSLAGVVAALDGGEQSKESWGGVAKEAAAAADEVLKGETVKASAPMHPPWCAEGDKATIAVRASNGLGGAAALPGEEDEFLELVKGAGDVAGLENALLGLARRQRGEQKGVNAHRGQQKQQDGGLKNGEANGGEAAGGKKGSRKWGDAQMSRPLLRAVVARAVEGGFWSLLHSLLHSGHLDSPAVYPSILQKLAAQQQLLLLEKCISAMPDLAPATLTFLLRFYLGTAEEPASAEQLNHLSAEKRRTVAQQIGKAGKRTEKEQGGGKEAKAKGGAVQVGALLAGAAALDGFTPAEQALHALLTPPRDEGVLFAALRPVTPQEVAALARYLVKWMRAYDKLPFTTPPPLSANIHVPSLSQVVLWTSLLLDAHLTKFMMVQDCHEAVLQLREAVARQVAFTKKLWPLEGMAKHMERKAQLPGTTAAGTAVAAYTVELLDLR